MKTYEIRRRTIDPVDWTAVIPPLDSNKIIITRGNEADGFYVRSDPLDPQTQLEVAQGVAHVIQTDTGSFIAGLPGNQPACWVLAASLAGTIVVEFCR
jgi:hypothetical protein